MQTGECLKLAKLFKEVMADSTELVNILSDLTGQYNRVIIVSQYKDMADFEGSWKRMEADPEKMKKMGEKMAGYTDLYLTGSREIFRVW
ncbi:hypothetical protein [Paraflavitalea speifideaquila]|uniref:hypothetical protein n=1 Tax=Paraflavitalea speifideaquila TaxID=3076558 RepID=UPI0028EC5C31|nr:hypothetical protein [Paraflavitalea speifideiaquila]